MKNVAILTINDISNFGNRLQNYALQRVLEKLNLNVITLENKKMILNNWILQQVKTAAGNTMKKISNKPEHKRYYNFIKFERNIKKSKRIICSNDFPEKIINKYDYFITGSDQVWNPTIGRLTALDLLSFAEPSKRISYAASFGINKLPQDYVEKTSKELKKFKYISVREDKGKEIIEELIERKDIEVLIDPTMLLTPKEWDKISEKPTMLKSKKFILNYFLGELSEQRKKEIESVAKKNKCEIINILDKSSPFYECGPSEFLYLEKNAFLICTDSFHSSVFAILYNRPFIIFDREDKEAKMNSRLETLISKLKLKNRKFEGKITKENLNHDYTDAYKILEKERIKSEKFLKNALDIKE